MYKEDFTKLFNHAWKTRDNQKKWIPEDWLIWKQIIISVDEKTLTGWIGMALAPKDKKAEKKKKKEEEESRKKKEKEEKERNKEKDQEGDKKKDEKKKKGFASWLFNKTQSSDQKSSIENNDL